MQPEGFYKNRTFPGPYQLSAPFKFWPAADWNYNESRPHLLDVYPEFIDAYRTLIFNGDFDGCVPCKRVHVAAAVFAGVPLSV